MTLARYVEGLTVGDEAINATTYHLSAQRHAELLKHELMRDHSWCWRTCASWSRDTVQTCDCGYDVFNMAGGETGWGALWSPTSEAIAVAERVRELMRAGLMWEGLTDRRSTDWEWARGYVAHLTRRMTALCNAQRDSWKRCGALASPEEQAEQKQKREALRLAALVEMGKGPHCEAEGAFGLRCTLQAGHDGDHMLSRKSRAEELSATPAGRRSEGGE